jgi:hypothetical protein
MLHWRDRLHPDGLHCWWSAADQVYEEYSVVRIQGSKDSAVLQALRADVSADGVALGADFSHVVDYRSDEVADGQAGV